MPNIVTSFGLNESITQWSSRGRLTEMFTCKYEGEDLQQEQAAQCGALDSIPKEALAETRELSGAHSQKQEGNSSDLSVLVGRPHRKKFSVADLLSQGVRDKRSEQSPWLGRCCLLGLGASGGGEGLQFPKETIVSCLGVAQMVVFSSVSQDVNGLAPVG